MGIVVPLKSRFVGPAAPVAFSAAEMEMLGRFAGDGYQYVLSIIGDDPFPQSVTLFKLLSGQEIHISKFFSDKPQFQMQIKDLEKKIISERTENKLSVLLESIPEQIFAPITFLREGRRREIAINRGDSNVIRIS